MTRALVTGGGARLGRAMALYLGSRGFDVAVHYASSGTGAQEVVNELQGLGRKAVTLQADLLMESAAHDLFVAAADRLGGPITCLVNNASIFERDTLDTATRESWDRHLESNLRAPFVLTQAMAAQGLQPIVDAQGEPVASGLIVNMLDQRIHKLTPDYTSYTIAKMGLWAMTQTMAQALAPVIRVNGIGPGPTLQGASQTEEQFASQRAATILKRGANPEDITAALGYFLDAPAVTGQMLAIDGGQHLAWETPDVVGVD
ncbi:NAD(P)-dependent dehydrogenase, short-chain alcohol dehydrogenase family [Cognatiyoonia koreensis]|uniref:NAD(P)-dependent dehydrogenase, short-chain alcohol dehydrogenase family n=1 Tax=Cognatiyoonia koreensis TaxID=364200 RepID=A0A1I0RGT1_9RHOB|nr:SDR family oxidoreductase [Cognatiyoonia koreensis]SEW39891.1 NAD(P)-dependent dehydrogenase, short-chain alcohol dehydrogenase family [Cognatiyoonia koreensis]